MKRSLLLDSGAFGVWAAQGRGQKVSIDLDDYITFCLNHPKVSYYVNLDVIPGVPNQKRTLTKANVEEACLQGWRNYKRMRVELPQPKIIPVFHQGDHWKWLDRYLSDGVTYIGISPANDMTTSQKMEWIQECRKYIFDGAGRRLVNQHGFAVTSYSLMKVWDWHSVDSASWKLAASWGAIYVPQETDGEEDYSKSPLSIVCSPNTIGKKNTWMRNAAAMPKGGVAHERILKYLSEMGVAMGSLTEKSVPAGYTLDRDREPCSEFWIDKANGRVGVPTEKGVMTSFEERARVTSRFMKRANKVLPVDHIYFAGAPMPYPLENSLGLRLLSYHEIGKGKKGTNKYLQAHLDRL